MIKGCWTIKEMRLTGGQLDGKLRRPNGLMDNGRSERQQGKGGKKKKKMEGESLKRQSK